MRRSKRAGLIVALALGVSVAVSCGASSEVVPVEFSAPFPSSELSDGAGATPSTAATDQTASTTPPATPSTEQQPEAQAMRWVEAAGNLAGLESECGNMSYVTGRPDQNALIAGVALQGLWSSTDGGDTWAPLGQGEGSAEITNRTSAIVFDPASRETFWESGIYGGGGGVYRTDDDGATFVQLGDVTHSDLVAVDLSDPARRTLLSGRHEDSALFRSTDGGTTWTDLSDSLPAEIGYTSSPYVVDANTHLLGTNSGDASGVFRTTDGGASWSRVFDSGVTGAPLRSSDGRLYWFRQGGGGLIASVDEGLTWTPVGGDGISAGDELIEPAEGRLAMLGTDSVVVSNDGGTTWERFGAPLPYEADGLAYSPQRDQFFVWRFECSFTEGNPILADSIMRLESVD